jgi:prepilin-type N-terminal cleavage/methylation domain-containing protein
MSGRRGLSLLEMLVALGAAALLLAALAGAVARAAQVRARATATAERIAVARTVLLRLADELVAALPADGPAAPERFVVRVPDAGAPFATLRFATGAGDPRLVAYAVERSQLVRRAASRFAPPEAAPVPVTLVEGVRAFRLRCFDGHAWSATWAGGLPRAVELSLVLEDGEPLATTVALPRGAAS